MWYIKSVQLAWFLVSSDGVTAARTFETAFGSEPDQVTSNRMISPTAPFLSRAVSAVENAEVTVQVQPGRVDLFLAPLSQALDMEDLFPSLERDIHLQNARRVTQNLEGAFRDVVRVALVINMTGNLADQASATSEFREIVGANFPFHDATDLVFQVNRRASIRDGLSRNRLMKFGTVTMQILAGTVQPNMLDALPVTEERWAATFMFDQNTVPDGKVLSAGDQATAFDVFFGDLDRILDVRMPISMLGD